MMYLILNQMCLIKKYFLIKKKRKIFMVGVWVFCEWRHKWRTFKPPWLTLPGLGPKPLDGSI